MFEMGDIYLYSGQGKTIFTTLAMVANHFFFFCSPNENIKMINTTIHVYCYYYVGLKAKETQLAKKSEAMVDLVNFSGHLKTQPQTGLLNESDQKSG